MIGLFLTIILVGVSTGLKRVNLQIDVLRHQLDWPDRKDVNGSSNQVQSITDVRGNSHVLAWNDQEEPLLKPRNENRHGSFLPTWDNNQQFPPWDKYRPGPPLVSWDHNQLGSLLPPWDDNQQLSWNYKQMPPSHNYRPLSTFASGDDYQDLAPWNYSRPLSASISGDDNQKLSSSMSGVDHQHLAPWHNYRPLSSSILDDENQQLPPWVDYRPGLPLTERLLKLNLLVWNQVERRFQELLSSAKKNLQHGLTDQTARSVGVMFTVAKLAQQLAKDCSPIQYVKTYRQIVSSKLFKADRSPLVAINQLSKLLDTLRINTKQVRALVFSEECQKCGCKQPNKNLQKLAREKKLAVALGSLAYAAFTSYPLKKAIRDNYVVDFMLNDQQAQGKMYSVIVKTARVLQLISKLQTCELQGVVSWLNGNLGNLNDDSSDYNDDSSYEIVP